MVDGRAHTPAATARTATRRHPAVACGGHGGHVPRGHRRRGRDPPLPVRGRGRGGGWGGRPGRRPPGWGRGRRGGGRRGAEARGGLAPTRRRVAPRRGVQSKQTRVERMGVASSSVASTGCRRDAEGCGRPKKKKKKKKSAHEPSPRGRIVRAGWVSTRTVGSAPRGRGRQPRHRRAPWPGQADCMCPSVSGGGGPSHVVGWPAAISHPIWAAYGWWAADGRLARQVGLSRGWPSAQDPMADARCPRWGVGSIFFDLLVD